MQPIIRGTRPSPRVGLVGNYSNEEMEQYDRLFPTIWKAPTLKHLEMDVQVKELDLIVVGYDANKQGNQWSTYFESVHVISFSPFTTLPGPIDHILIDTIEKSKNEEYLLPRTKLPFHQRRELDLLLIENIFGWLQINVYIPNAPQERFTEMIDRASEIVKNGAIIIDRNADIPLATIYKREESNLGVAWLSNPVFDQVKWVELIAMEWAKDDKEGFPEFGDWTKSSEWMTTEEEDLVKNIDQLEASKQEVMNEFDLKIANFRSDLASANLVADKGLRRLITAQGDNLVDEVASVFQEFGFEVDNMDEVIDPKSSKREDLRLRVPSDDSDWEAIVEVRGYSRRTGDTKDFLRISKFVSFYVREKKGRLPAKKIYVVNGQIELSPELRQDVLASADEYLQEFGEDGGLIISTLDLFRAMKLVDQLGKDRIKESIKGMTGRWSLDFIGEEH